MKILCRITLFFFVCAGFMGKATAQKSPLVTNLTTVMEGSNIVDRDGDGIEDERDQYPQDATRWQDRADLLITTDSLSGWKVPTYLEYSQLSQPVLDTGNVRFGLASLRAEGSAEEYTTVNYFTRDFVENALDARGYRYLKFWFYRRETGVAPTHLEVLIKRPDGPVYYCAFASQNAIQSGWQYLSIDLVKPDQDGIDNQDPVPQDVVWDNCVLSDSSDLVGIQGIIIRQFQASTGWVVAGIDDIRFSDNPESPERNFFRDSDGDSYYDWVDAFPEDSTEWQDSDENGIGDNADSKADNDEDGILDYLDYDDDNDQVRDAEDSFPLDATEFQDSDDDGIGDNTDTDRDNDGIDDEQDQYPEDASRWQDCPRDFSGYGDAEEFITQWQTDMPGTSDDNQITLNVAPGVTYDFSVDWGDGSFNDNVSTDITHTYAVPGRYEVRVTGIFPQIWFPISSLSDAPKLISVDQWGNRQWSSMRQAFAGSNVKFIASDVPDLSQVTDMAYMFGLAFKFNSSIGCWDVSNVENFMGMFFAAYEFNQEIGDWNVSNATDMSRMFNNAGKFNSDIRHWKVSNVVDMDSIFLESGLSDTHYEALLDHWGRLPNLQTGVEFHASNRYSYEGAYGRNRLTDEFGWNITDNGVVDATVDDPPNLRDAGVHKSSPFDFLSVRIENVGGSELTNCTITPSLPAGTAVIGRSDDRTACVITGKISQPIAEATSFTVEAFNFFGSSQATVVLEDLNVRPFHTADSGPWIFDRRYPAIPNTENKIEGAASMESVGEHVDRFAIDLAEPVDASDNRFLEFWYYIEDVTKIKKDLGAQIEISSSQYYDTEELNWTLHKLDLQNDWNHIVLDLQEGRHRSKTDIAIDFTRLSRFRIYHFNTGSMTTRIDDVRFFGIDEIDQMHSSHSEN